MPEVHPDREKIIDELIKFTPHKIIMNKFKVSAHTLNEYLNKYVETTRKRKEIPPDQSDGQWGLFWWARVRRR